MGCSSGNGTRADGGDGRPFPRLRKAFRAIDGHWIGDLIGALCLFGTLWAALVIGWALA